VPTVFTRSGGDLAWLHYRHRISRPPVWQGNELVDDFRVLKVDGFKPGMFPPSLITNFLGYNAGLERNRAGIVNQPRGANGDYWVGDLMLECTAKVSGPGDEIVLELSKGLNRFRARFAEGKVTLSRTGPGGKELATRPTPIAAGGTYALRFANFDCRLRVWVNEKAIDFGTEADYAPLDLDRHEPFSALLGGVISPDADGSTLVNDIMAPAGIGAKGSVEVSKIVLWKDTFFTPADGRPATEVDTFYVQPHHYLCLGDNSGFSSDGRTWGLVPERLMLGKAVFIFYPAPPFVRLSHNRAGFIR
jgi:signal peptidase I